MQKEDPMLKIMSHYNQNVVNIVTKLAPEMMGYLHEYMQEHHPDASLAPEGYDETSNVLVLQVMGSNSDPSKFVRIIPADEPNGERPYTFMTTSHSPFGGPN